MPFDARIPNSNTVAALEEPAHKLRQFDSTREVFADLEAHSNLKEALDLFFETASTEEINRRLHDEIYVTHVEVAVG